ncbi:MAG: flagellar protein FlgN [Nitrospinota bacterium]
MKAIENLADTLAENAELYERIARITKKEKSVLESASLERLNELIKEKESVAQRIRTLEKKKTALLEEIGKELGRQPGELTLKEIAETKEYGTRYGERLMSLRERLKKAGEAAATANDINRSIIGGAISTVLESIRYAVGLIEPAITYSPRLSIKNSALSGRVVRKSY